MGTDKGRIPFPAIWFRVPEDRFNPRFQDGEMIVPDARNSRKKEGLIAPHLGFDFLEIGDPLLKWRVRG